MTPIRIRAALIGALALLLLSGCAARPPVFHECGGNNCHKQEEPDPRTL